MDYYAGLDVSLELTSVCLVDATGEVVREAKVASEPEALVRFMCEQQLPVARVALEAGPLSQWLHAGLVEAGFDAVLLETRHVKAALSAMTVKTDRRDARGIAQLLRLGWFRPVHVKSAGAQELRALLTARKLIQAKLLDIESGTRGVLRGFGLKVRHHQSRPLRGAGQRACSRSSHAGAGGRLDACRSLGTADGVLAPSPHDPLAGPCRSSVPAVDECAWRWRHRRDHVQERRGRSRPVPALARCRSALRAYASQVSVGREGRDRRDQQGGGPDGPHSPLRSGKRDAQPNGAHVAAEELGDGRGQAARREEGAGGAGAQARRHPPPHVVDGTTFRWTGEAAALA